MFINFTNHPCSNWSDSQKKTGEQWGVIEDLPFPNVNPYWNEQELDNLANQIAMQIIEKTPTAVLCQGEMTLAFRITSLLKAAGILVVAACSERKSNEIISPDGTVKKYVEFEFIQYREF
ncbi:MAG: hypothetical protein RR131_09360 [Anaerovorax sp.]